MEDRIKELEGRIESLQNNSGEMLRSWITDSYLCAVKTWIDAINLSCKNLAVYIFTDIMRVSYCP